MSLKDKIISKGNEFTASLDKSNISFGLFILFIVGVFATESFRALSSISLAGITILALLSIDKNSLGKIKSALPVLLFTLVFFMHVLDAITTDFMTNSDYLIERVMIKVPFLLLPFSILVLPKLSLKRYHFLILTFVLCSVFIAVKATIYYLLHPTEVQELYLRSKTIPLPLNHVRYSLMLSLSIFLSAYLYIKKEWFFSPVETKIYGGFALFLFIFLHLLSVRSGLLAFYILAVMIVLAYAWRTKKYKQMALALSIFIAIPLASFFAVPTFKNKVTNTIEDINNTQYEYFANFHSLTARVFSYKVAYHLIQKSPIMGVGIGNLEREVNKQYISEYNEITPGNRLMPHNQFLNFTVAFGLLGLIIFCIGFYGILFFKKYRTHSVLLVQLLIISISFLFESTLETQLGANFTLSFIVIPLYYLVSNASREEATI